MFPALKRDLWWTLTGPCSFSILQIKFWAFKIVLKILLNYSREIQSPKNLSSLNNSLLQKPIWNSLTCWDKFHKIKDQSKINLSTNLEIRELVSNLSQLLNSRTTWIIILVHKFIMLQNWTKIWLKVLILKKYLD